MLLNPSIQCVECGAFDVVAVAPGGEGVRNETIAAYLKRPTPAVAWCEKHWTYSWRRQGALAIEAPPGPEIPADTQGEDDDMHGIFAPSFDEARKAFLTALLDFLNSPTEPAGVKRAEVRSTVSSIEQLAILTLPAEPPAGV